MIRLGLLILISFYSSGKLVSAQPIKVISFNIRLDLVSDGANQWSNRSETVMDFIKYESPDFLGMQEVLPGQKDDILNRLAEYSSIGVARDDGRDQGEFSPIFYLNKKWNVLTSGTFWLSETPEKPSKGWDAACPRICTWAHFENVESRKTLWVFNTHLDHVGVKAREFGMVLIIEKIKELIKNEPVLLTGDFNTEPNTTPIRMIKKFGLQDTYEWADVTYGSAGTFNGFDKNSIPSRRIDYVFTNPKLKALGYSTDSRLIEGRFLSDHFPVIVEVNML